MKRLFLRYLGVLGVIGLLGAFAALPAAAMDTRQGQSVSISAGQTIHDDVYAAGNSVDVAGTIDGDLVAAGNTVTISGVVTKDVFVVANEVNITGEIDGSLRALASSMTLGGQVKADALIGGGNLNLTSSGSVGRDLAMGVGSATVFGSVARNAYVGGGNVTLGGPIGGDVKASVSDLTLNSSAAIQGKLTYSADQAAAIASGATTAGGVERTAQPVTTRPTFGDQVLGAVRGLVGIIAFGLLLLWVFPGFSRTAGPTLTRRPWASLGIGLALLVGVPLVAVIAFVVGLFVGGWWISLMLVGLYTAALAAAYALGGFATGRLALRALGSAAPNRALALILGVLLLWVIGFVPVLGGLVGFAAVVFGLGALGVSAWTSRFGGGGQAPEPVEAPITMPPLPQRQVPMPT